MIASFYMNGDLWRVEFVNPWSHLLVDRTNRHTVATTDPKTRRVYLSWNLGGSFLSRVLVHELSHCAMISFGLLKSIHRMVRPEYWIDAEEWICNYIADYGRGIFLIADQILFNIWG